MTDKELLELAAKAAGLKIVGMVDEMIAQPDHKAGGLVIRNDRGGDSCWNPRTDDGDALRLAVKLGATIYTSIAHCHIWADDENEISIAEEQSQDAGQATRRAIVRSAAEIGKGMHPVVLGGLPEDNYYKTQAEAEGFRKEDEIGKAML